jgi:hypothetical protein
MSRLPGRTTQISQLLLVELRGRLSNTDVKDSVRNARAVTDATADVTSVERTATCSARSAREPVRLRLGDAVVAELVAKFAAGTTRQELADRYGVSLSSVKRLLRGSGALGT